MKCAEDLYRHRNCNHSVHFRSKCQSGSKEASKKRKKE
uniref:Uncharacterized protein n=1 Tax=Rhizophora mucronata TaxID=61149 RepID=A0A2P2MYS0_RHIMU